MERHLLMVISRWTRFWTSCTGSSNGSTGPWKGCRASGSACMCAGKLRGTAYPLTWPCARSWLVLFEANVGGFMIAFNPRHQHEISVFRDLPLKRDRYLMWRDRHVGLISSKLTEVVAQRLERAAEVVGDPSCVIAGTDCRASIPPPAWAGFPADVVWAKLGDA